MIPRAMAALPLCCLLSFAAGADETPGGGGLEATASPPPAKAVAVDRSWLYNDPTRIPVPGQAVAVSRFTYAGGGSPTRPFAGNLGTGGALVEVGGEVGILPSISLLATGAQGQDAGGASQTGVILGLRWSLLPRSIRETQVVLSAGYLRELRGDSGAWARLSLGHEAGPARLAFSVHAERAFAAQHDSLDVMVTAGATFPVAGTLRAGVEYVGQDLEGLAEDDAEGGARHVVGPVLSVALFDQKLSLVGGPAVALGSDQGRVLGRVAVVCQF